MISTPPITSTMASTDCSGCLQPKDTILPSWVRMHACTCRMAVILLCLVVHQQILLFPAKIHTCVSLVCVCDAGHTSMNVLCVCIYPTTSRSSLIIVLFITACKHIIIRLYADTYTHTCTYTRTRSCMLQVFHSRRKSKCSPLPSAPATPSWCPTPSTRWADLSSSTRS